jgi:hypothetical protein
MGILRIGLAILTGGALAVAAPEAGAAPVTVGPLNFSGPINGEDPGFTADVDVEFSFDDACVSSSCTLQITLTYNSSGGLSAIGQTLSGVVFDAEDQNAALFDLDVVLSTSTVTAQSLVGAGSDDALADFGNPPNSNVDVSGHWGFRSGYASSNVPPLGSNVLSSVGDLAPDTDVLGNGDLFSGTISDVEPNPPDGTSFSIVDPDTTCTGPPGSATCGSLTGGFQDGQNRAWIKSSAVAMLVYDGTTHQLTDIQNVTPIFGTEGNHIVPEPGALAFLGLLGLALRQRARRRD